jgi:hypothetical protein
MRKIRLMILTFCICVSMFHLNLVAQEDSLLLEVQTFSLLEGHTTIEWSPDSSRLIVSNSDNVFICNITKACVALSEDIIPLVSSLSWHPTENIIATSGSMFNLWSDDGESLSFLDFPDNEAPEGVVDWSTNGNLLAFTTVETINRSSSYSAYIWSVDDGSIVNAVNEISTGRYVSIEKQQLLQKD